MAVVSLVMNLFNNLKSKKQINYRYVIISTDALMDLLKWLIENVRKTRKIKTTFIFEHCRYIDIII